MGCVAGHLCWFQVLMLWATSVVRSRRHRRSRLRPHIAFPRRDQLFDIGFVERLLVAELMSDQRDPCKMLHRLHLHIGME